MRRRHLVPVPDVASLADLNARLRAGCEQDLARRITGHPDSVGEALERERALLRGLSDEPLQTAEQVTPRVDAKALVSVRQNRYSVPVALVELRMPRRSAPTRSRSRMATSRSQATTDSSGASGPARGLITTSRCWRAKPAALIGSVALAQERGRGAWPDCLDELWGRIAERYGPSEAARQMVDVLMLCGEHGPAQTELAVRGALAAGAHDRCAVSVLARRTGPSRHVPIDVKGV